MSNKLVVFYSRAGENYVNGQIKNLETGNTQIAADMIKKLTGADIFKIEQEKEYSYNYSECTSQAREDQRNNARPKLKNWLESIDRYDVIYLCYPNYWSTMPMAVFTFLEHFDFSNKTIKPLCTHEGSGMGSSVLDIKKLCPTANVEKGLAVYGSSVLKSEKEIKQWI